MNVTIILLLKTTYMYLNYKLNNVKYISYMIFYANSIPESVQSLPTLSFDSFSIYQRPLSAPALCLPLILQLLVYFLVLIGNHLTFVCEGVVRWQQQKPQSFN